ncbi:MAG: hypothetical protein KDK54_13190 [Leptospiraceae bacterium]|nr:hypothetical protein [Leptospiraceae bacterium]
MRKLKLQLELLSPVILTNLSGDENTVSTNQYIPGSMILGALASTFIQERKLGKNAHKNEEFRKWFISQNIIFENVYPTDTIDGYKIVFFPHPNYFQNQKGEEGNLYNLFENYNPEETYSKFERFTSIRNGVCVPYSPRSNYNFHHERDYSSGTSKQGIIFNYESIAEGSQFIGSIDIKDPYYQSFNQWLGKERILSIGRSRTAQYGKVKVRFIEEKFSEDNQRIDGTSFIIHFLSDVILRNEYGFPCSEIRELERLFPGCKIEKSIFGKKNQEGFHGAWMLRKISDISFQAGSSFLINIVDQSKKSEVLEKLNSLIQTGIGERIQEGFGKFQISKEISSIININNDDSTNSTGEPKTLIPNSKEWEGLVKKIFNTEVKKLIYRKALQDVEELKIRREKSTIAGHLLEFVDPKTGRFHYFTKTDEKKEGKELKRTFERNVEKLEIKGEFLFEYFRNLDLKNHKIIPEGSELKDMMRDYPFLKEGIGEEELYKFYFATFASLMRKKIKRGKAKS